MDAFYTPSALASELVAASSLTSPDSVADFAMGDGALLWAARRRWPSAKLAGVDLDEAAGRAAGIRLADLDFRTRDFLAAETQLELRSGARFDCILLNPPFSQRGAGSLQVELAYRTLRCSKALAFVVSATELLAPEGEIVAVVPSSVLTSERDEHALACLREQFRIDVVGAPRLFPGLNISVVLIGVRRGLVEDGRASASACPEHCRGSVAIQRGSLSVNLSRSRPGNMQFIHSTDLWQNKVRSSLRRVAWGRYIDGERVLLPRVGRVSLGKIVVASFPRPVVLSDCVIALESAERPAQAVADELMQHFAELRNSYIGSCAPYLTLRRLSKLMGELGFHSLKSDKHAQKEVIDPDILLSTAHYSTRASLPSGAVKMYALPPA